MVFNRAVRWQLSDLRDERGRDALPSRMKKESTMSQNFVLGHHMGLRQRSSLEASSRQSKREDLC